MSVYNVMVYSNQSASLIIPIQVHITHVLMIVYCAVPQPSRVYHLLSHDVDCVFDQSSSIGVVMSINSWVLFFYCRARYSALLLVLVTAFQQTLSAHGVWNCWNYFLVSLVWAMLWNIMPKCMLNSISAFCRLLEAEPFQVITYTASSEQILKIKIRKVTLAEILRTKLRWTVPKYFVASALESADFF